MRIGMNIKAKFGDGSVIQRELIYTEWKPLGRLCKMCNPFFNESRTTLPLNVLFKALCHAKKQKEKTLNYPYLYNCLKGSLQKSVAPEIRRRLYYKALKKYCRLLYITEFYKCFVLLWTRLTMFSLSWLRVIVKNPCLGWLEGRRSRSMLLSPLPSQTCRNSSTQKYLNRLNSVSKLQIVQKGA